MDKLITCSTLLISSVLLSSPGYASDTCDVIGGGEGYTSLLDKQNVESYVTANNFEELKGYVEAGETNIYIPGNATITVPNESGALRLKEGTTLFSDRGLAGSKGALLDTPWLDDNPGKYAVIIMESNVRVTGFRIKGPTSSSKTKNRIIGLQTTPSAGNIEVDNNEMYDWPWAAVSVKKSTGNNVHHNYIHDNLRSQLGYGVVVQNGNAEAKIYCNVFNANRHAIAGSGKEGEGYQADHNLVLNGGGRAVYHQFDMHKGDTGFGGKYINASENIFDFGRHGTSNRASILIRGIPQDGPITVEGNTFSQGWKVGKQTAVSGVEGSIPSEDEIFSTNQFNIKVTYTKNDTGVCNVNYQDNSYPVNCDSVASVLTKKGGKNETANCSISEDGELTGNYNAIQRQNYNSSCELQFEQDPNNKVVPIGNSSGGVSRIAVKRGTADNMMTGFLLKLNGSEDNTLSDGKRGRQEVSSCYITDEEFSALSPEEQNFRRASHDMYHGCAQTSNREVSYNFYLGFYDEPASSYLTWDSIVMQLHAQNDKDRYCIPNSGTPANLCNQDTGTLGVSERSESAYNSLLSQGAVFEKDVQPPLSFRIKDGYFSIVATSGLTDASGTPSLFSPSKNCSLNVNKAAVGEVKTCADTGKTATVVYRHPLDENFPSGTAIHFTVTLQWPSISDDEKHLKVEYINPTTGETETLVDSSSIPFGYYDDYYPYFKAGVYRQNANVIPTRVGIAHFTMSE